MPRGRRPFGRLAFARVVSNEAFCFSCRSLAGSKRELVESAWGWACGSSPLDARKSRAELFCSQPEVWMHPRRANPPISASGMSLRIFVDTSLEGRSRPLRPRALQAADRSTRRRRVYRLADGVITASSKIADWAPRTADGPSSLPARRARSSNLARTCPQGERRELMAPWRLLRRRRASSRRNAGP